MVNVHNKEARVHALAFAKPPRGFVTLKPGDNFVEDADWKRVEDGAAELVKAGVLTVKTGVATPPSPAPVQRTTEADLEKKEEDEGDMETVNTKVKSKKSW